MKIMGSKALAATAARFLLSAIWFGAPSTAAAANGTVTLNFNSLPSAQGWTYLDDGVPEISVFWVSGGVLHQSSIGVGGRAPLYTLFGDLAPVRFTLSIRARVLEEEWPSSGNAYGFDFGATIDNEQFEIGLGVGRMSMSTGVGTLTRSIDTATFHNYRLEAIPGVGYDVFVDDVLVASGPPFCFSCFGVEVPDRLFLGDGTQGQNAQAEVTSYTFTQWVAVSIDIKPGSYPNSINLGSGGTVPVAIFSTPTFDARTVDPTSVTLAGAGVALKGKGTPMASVQDVNGDGLPDLVVHVSTEALQLSAGDTLAVLEGRTFDGQRIRGSDSIRIVP